MKPSATSLSLLCAGLLAWCQHALAANGLPDPPTSVPSAITLYLELVVNEESSGNVVPVQLRDGHFLVSAAALRELHVRTEAPDTALVAVDQIAGVKVEYDNLAQRLLISIPASWLPTQEIGSSGRMLPNMTASGSGLLLNYDLYASGLDQSDAAVSVWTEQRFFNADGVFSNTGVYSGSVQAGTSGSYRRYDTKWTHADPQEVRTLTVGDMITGTLPWGNAARIGGIQLARSFAIRPDLVTYPLPRFSGEAAVPSAVDLFINGYRASSQTVQSGPFTLNSTPFINGAGEASLVTTDVLGRQVLTTVPFYVANTLLKPKTTDYALSIGTLRQNYGIEDFSYGEWVSSASGRLGLTDYLTLEGRGELADGLTLGGAGLVASLERWGVVNLALSNSENSSSLGNRGHGQQWNYGYQYNSQLFGVGVQQTLQDPNYTDLGLLGGVPSAGPRIMSRSTQFSVSGSLGAWGSVSLAWFDVLAHDGLQTQIASLNFSRALNSRNFISAFLTHSPTTGQHSMQLQWTFVLGKQGSVSLTRTENGPVHGNQVQYSRTPDSDGGLGVNLAYSNGTGMQDYSQASAIWRAAQVQLQGGMYGQGNRTSTWAGASGAIVVMEGDVFATNRINDSFVLISTAGVEGVPVRFENQLVGETDIKGHLLVTGVNAYYPSRFEIDTLNLPDFLVVKQTEQRIILPSGSGALMRFEINPILAAGITLVDERGQPLPVGLQVEHLGNGNRAIVGWDGQVYLEGLLIENELRVSGTNFPSCRARFTLTASAHGILRLGPLVCRPQASFASNPPQGAFF